MQAGGNDMLVEVTPKKLVLDTYVAFVQDDSAGAVATFSGVTRNTFQGKRVVTLEYEAYAGMAEKILRVCARVKFARTFYRSRLLYFPVLPTHHTS